MQCYDGPSLPIPKILQRSILTTAYSVGNNTNTCFEYTSINTRTHPKTNFSKLMKRQNKELRSSLSCYHPYLNNIFFFLQSILLNYVPLITEAQQSVGNLYDKSLSFVYP